MYKVKKHKVAQKDTLISIAKKYKHKSWKTIWDDARNAKVKKTRKVPESIEPGDVLIIPFNESERKAISEERFKLTERFDAELRLAGGLLDQADTIAAAGKLISKRLKNKDKVFKDAIKLLNDCKSSSKKWKDGIDTAAKVALLLNGLRGLAKTGKAASTATGDELARLNKSMKTQSLFMMTGPVENAILDAGIKYLMDNNNDVSELGKTVGIVAKWWGDVGTPSFWSGAVTAWWKGGKSWEQAFQYDFDVDIASQVYVFEKQRIVVTGKLRIQVQAAEKAAQKMLADAGKAHKRAKELEKKLMALPQL